MSATSGLSNFFSKPRSYPRPTIKCSQCGAEKILCWGEKNRPHFRHKSSDKECTGNSVETDSHSMCKKLLCEFLDKDGIIKFESACHVCGIIMDDVITVPKCDTHTEEYRHNDVIFDVGCLSGGKLLQYGIEVRHTHPTDNFKGREDVEWYEVETISTLNKLDTSENITEITLLDVRMDNVCSKKCAEHFEYISPDGTKIYIQYDDNNTHSKHRDNILDNITLAKRLGYYRSSSIYNGSTIRIVIDEAMRGGYLPSIEHWSTIPFTRDEIASGINIDGYSLTSKRYNKLWKILLSQGRCLKCRNKHEVSFGRCYCIPCYKDVKDDHAKIKKTLQIRQRLTKAKFDEIKIVSTRKNELIEHLKFLHTISTVDRTGNQCTKCNIKTEGIWWYGKVVSICYNCAEMIYLIKCIPSNDQ